jgi:DNA-binding IclR family transcriptional regulator
MDTLTIEKPIGKSKDDDVQLRTVGRAADVLELLIADGAVTLKGVQRRLNLGHTVAHRILRTWMALEFVTFDRERKVYRAGSKLLWAGLKIRSALDNPDTDMRVTALSERLGFNANVGVLEGRLVMHVAARRGRHAIPFQNDIGTAVPAGTSSLGRVLLAYMSESQVVKLYSNDDACASVEHELPEFLRDLRTIRKQGYVTSFRTLEAGTGSVAVPLRDASSRVVAALNVVGPVDEFKSSALNDILSVLQDVARKPIELPPMLSGEIGRYS